MGHIRQYTTDFIKPSTFDYYCFSGDQHLRQMSMLSDSSDPKRPFKGLSYRNDLISSICSILEITAGLCTAETPLPLPQGGGGDFVKIFNSWMFEGMSSCYKNMCARITCHNHTKTNNNNYHGNSILSGSICLAFLWRFSHIWTHMH